MGFPNRYFPDLKDHLLIDVTGNQYIQLVMGWKNGNYLYQVLRHLEVSEDGKVIIHQNNVDKPLAEELIAQGIPEELIKKMEEVFVLCLVLCVA
ncbi:MAG: element excision factor XisI family protein [Bacteroidota bacterium]